MFFVRCTAAVTLWSVVWFLGACGFVFPMESADDPFVVVRTERTAHKVALAELAAVIQTHCSLLLHEGSLGGGVLLEGGGARAGRWVGGRRQMGHLGARPWRPRQRAGHLGSHFGRPRTEWGS